MKKLLLLSVFAALFICFNSCSDDNELAKTKLILNYENPKDITDFVAKDLTFKVTNINTGVVNEIQLPIVDDLFLEEGMYTFTIEGDCEYCDETETIEASVKGIKDNVTITGETSTLNIKLFLSNSKSGFVFEEIFVTRTKTVEGKLYGSDQFFEIYNNSDEDLDASELCIAETVFTSSIKYEYTPDIMSEYVTVGAIYSLPKVEGGYIIKPGESLTICNVGINHKENCESSVDLSKADYEWYDDYQYDVDAVEVPNMVKVFNVVPTMWTPHSMGLKSYIIFKLDKPAEEFIAENTYTYSYTRSSGSVSSRDAVKVKNTLIFDAVNMSNPTKYIWGVIDPSLDFSYACPGDGDERYGKSIKRKVAYTTSDGRKILMDSNNSKIDFIQGAAPAPGAVE